MTAMETAVITAMNTAVMAATYAAVLTAMETAAMTDRETAVRTALCLIYLIFGVVLREECTVSKDMKMAHTPINDQ